MNEENQSKPETEQEAVATERQTALLEHFRNLEGQNNFLLQQVAYILQALGEQRAALQENQEVVRQEFKRFQTGGPQRAMAGIFYKLFRDLIGLMNQLDELVALGKTGDRTDEERAWVRSLEMLHGQLEFILTEWGCEPVDVELFVTPFDPAHHESVPAEGEVPTHDPEGEPIPKGRVVKVVQRGWTLQGAVLQYPRVVVS